MAGEQGEVRTGAKTGFQLCRLPVGPQGGQGQTHTKALADLNKQDIVNSVRSSVPGPAVHVPHRTSNSHRKASLSRLTSYETHLVALGKQLESTRITRKGDTRSQVAPPPLKVVAGGKQCSSRSTITPTKTCSADIYRLIKRRVGRSLKRTHCKGNLVSSRKQVAHKSLGTKSDLSGFKRVPRPLFKQHSPGSHRQHNSGCLYQQRRGDEVGLPVCPTVEKPVLVHQETGMVKQNGPFTQRFSKLYAPGGTSHKWTCLPPDSTTNCYSLCRRFWIPRHRQWMHSACHGKFWILMPTSSHLGQSGGEVAGLPMQQDHSDRTRVAQHALVLGSSSNVQSDPPVSAQPAQSGVSTIQPDPAQEPVKPEPTCLAPRATAIKEQGFSEAVAARIEAPQRGSTRFVYEQSGPFLQSGASVIRWTSGHHL